MTKKELELGKERYRREHAQYINEGWIREIYDTGWGMVCAIAESSYVVFAYGVIDPEKDMTVLFHFRGEEIWNLLEDPSWSNFQAFNRAMQQLKQNRAFVMIPSLAGKFRELYNSWGPDKQPDIDRAKEAARLAEIAKKRDSFWGRFKRNARNAVDELFSG